MKTKHLLISILLMLLSAGAYAQGENNMWTFGTHLGLDFNGGGPVSYSNAGDTWEGAATLSNYSGKLLFYCDGNVVFDRTHSAMPNGGLMKGHRSTTQGVAIALLSSADSLYYVFLLQDHGSKGFLSYSIVDLKLNGGLGDVIPGAKNIIIDSFMSEKMIIAGSCNKQWLLTHRRDSAVFNAYPITTTGIGTVVRSSIGWTRLLSDAVFSTGEMKISRDDRRIALITRLSPHYSSAAELYDFDFNTGVVSNYLFLDSFSSNCYGLEFSADASKLYLATNNLLQYDLTSGSIHSIRSSSQLIAKKHFWGMRSGPDKMIYLMPEPSYGNFDRIRYSDLPGSLCNYEANILTSKVFWSLCLGFGNNFLPLKTKMADTFVRSNHWEICYGDSAVINRSMYKSNLWFDGSTSNSRAFSSPGMYWVESITDCITSIDTFYISTKPYDTSLSIKRDTTLCPGLKIKVYAVKGRDLYRWNDGDTLSEKELFPPNTYILKSRNHCSIFVDTYLIKEKPITISSYNQDTFMCTKSAITLLSRPLSDSVKWFDGKTSNSNTIPGDPGKYWVKSFKNCAILVDTFTVIIRFEDTIKSLENITICPGKHLKLHGRVPMDNYVWNTGESTDEIEINTGGKYWVTSVSDCKLYVDTFFIEKKSYTITNQKTDTSVCFLKKLTLNAPSEFNSYLWSDATTKMNTTIYTSGRVIVMATDSVHCEILIKEFNVSMVDFSSNIPDTSTCNEDTIILDATISDAAARYRWNVGDTTAKLKVTTGSRYVFITVDGCTLIDSVAVRQFPMKVSIGEDTSLRKGTKTILKADVDNVSYKWSTGATSQSIEVSESGNYGVTIFKDACSGKSEIKISFVNCDNCTAFPTGFTPNNDGINDYFKPILNCPPVSYQLKIMNRWGQEVYTSSNPNDKWDGTSNGHALDGGVYFYMLKVKFEAQNDEEKMFKGEITLLR